MAKDAKGHGSDARGNAMPIAGHPYHTKSDAELRYIASDAHAAAQNMQGHDINAENKYRDQVNDAQSVLGYRQRGGSQVQPAPAAHASGVASVGRLGPNGEALQGAHANTDRFGVPHSKFGPDNPNHREHVGRK